MKGSMELVPLNQDWTGSEAKVDIKAIYRRPDAAGSVSLTGALPLRRHQQWMAKGFEYVSLASVDDINAVISDLRAAGHDPRSFQGSYDRGRFNQAAYVAFATKADEVKHAKLKALAEEHGPTLLRSMLEAQGALIPAWLTEMPEPTKAKKTKEPEAK
jgi:hypothetical protein